MTVGTSGRMLGLSRAISFSSAPGSGMAYTATVTPLYSACSDRPVPMAWNSGMTVSITSSS